MTKCSAATHQEDTATPRNYRHEYEGSEKETTKIIIKKMISL